MARTKKGSGGIWDIVTHKAKVKVKLKTKKLNGGIRQRHKAFPLVFVLERYEGRDCSAWGI